MSYHSFKRALREQKIERKCMLLFGISLFILITLSFTSVDRITDVIISDVYRRLGQASTDLVLYDLHFGAWNNLEYPSLINLEENLRKELIGSRFKWDVLAERADEVAWVDLKDRPPTSNVEEQEILKKLAQRYEAISESSEVNKGASPDRTGQDRNTSKLVPNDLKSAVAEAISPNPESTRIYAERYSTEDETYYYYSPVKFGAVCRQCHFSVDTSTASMIDVDLSPSPFRAIKVSVPFKATQDVVHWTRSLLIAVAFATVGLALLLLYAIVHFIVVKPLIHLRDVSDEISRGNIAMRADLHTNDEFEDLAIAFNKMLRHLTDTQAELKTVNTDLDNRLDQLAQLNMRLYEMNRLKDDFMANMSHELRTPLNSIIGFSEVLQGINSLNDKQKRYAQNIQKSGRILLDMINDILDLAKMEAGKMDIRPTEFRIDTVINAQCDMVRSLTEEKNIDVTVDITSELPHLYQDQSKVQQILTNLLSNAIKFTPEGGRIKVIARQSASDRLELLVIDTGVGIAEEDREVVFEKFRQSRAVLGNDGLTRAYSGTGLGLSIVRELCKLLGGEVSVKSELGRGSEFRVELPMSLPNQLQLESRIAAKLNESSSSRREFTAAGSET